MSNERLSADQTQDFIEPSNLNLSGLLWVTGREWTSTISQESLALTHQPHKEGKSGSTRHIVLFSALTALLLVGAATLTQARVGSEAPQEIVKTTQVK